MLYLAKHMVGMRFASGEYFEIVYDEEHEGVIAGPNATGSLAFGE